MRRWLVALALVASSLTAGAQGLRGGPLGRPTADYAYIPAPTGCASGLVPYFDASLKLVCSPTVYAPATDTTTLTGSLVARNLTATALATPTVTSVTPTLTKIGSITTVAGSALVDGDSFTIKYAPGLTVPCEFDLSPGDGTTGGAVPILFTAGDSADTVRDNIILTLNAAAGTALTASSGGAATVSLVLDTPGAAGDTNTENVANAGFTVAGFANPTAATTYGYKVVSYLAGGVNGTAASTEVTTAAGHATLSASNYVTVVFAPSAGSTSTRLYRTTGGTAPPKLLYTGTATSYVDTGAAGTAQTPATANTTGIVLANRVLVGDGDFPGYSSVSFPTSGFSVNGVGRPGIYVGGVKYAEITTAGLDISASTGAIRLGTSLNATLRRTATGEITLGSSLALNDGVLQLNKVVRNSASGAQASSGVSTELVTIAASASTDTTANLLPADAYIEAVTVNVVTAIPTAATFDVGDAVTAGRFATGVAVAAGTKAVGLTHTDQTGAAGPKQTTAAKVRITPNATPAAATGVVRVDVFWRFYTAGAT